MTLLPTLNRLRLLKRFLESALWAETSSPGLVIVDDNDYQSNKDKYDSLMPLIHKLGWTLFNSGDAVKMGDKVRAAFDSPLFTHGDIKWVNLLNDDHVIKTKGWDKKLVAKLDGTNFVTCQDNWMSPRKAAGATVWSKALLDTVGFPIYPPGMQHLFIDDLWESIGKGTGIWDIDHSVVIEHHNQLKTPNERDETFYSVYGRNPDLSQHPMWQNDRKVFEEFMKNEYLGTRNKIRKLRGMSEIKYQ